MDDPAVRALIRLCGTQGGWKAVGTRLGVNPQTVYQIVTRRTTESGTVRGVGRKLRERLEDKFPGWLQLGGIELQEPAAHYHSTGQTNTPTGAGVYHGMRLPSQKLTPPKVSWEAVLTTDTPTEFETELPDNAMAPDAPKGSRVILLRGVEPEPGDWVLASDSRGQAYFREYRALTPGRWVAHALNEAFLPLDSEAEGLKVVAVFDGMRGRKARR